MATNRGTYDHRQFLHYPDKDPFSEVAQRRLDELINDFLETGIAFANGATVRSVNIQSRTGGVELSDGHLDDAVHQEYQAIGDATANVSGNEEDEDFESEFSKVDKGKGRDEREGPGLKGLWNSTGRFSPDPSPPELSVDDATSLLSESGSQDPEGSNGIPEHRDEFFEVYEIEELDEGVEGYEEDDDLVNTEFIPGHSSSLSSEQEIIYIGDSDEEDEPREAMSDNEADNVFEDIRERGWMHGAVQDDDGSEKRPNWGSDSEFGEEQEQLEFGGVWDYDLQGQNVDDNAQEPEWRQNQGKESDDEEGGYMTIDGGQEEDGGDDDGDRRPHIGRRFFPSTPLSTPLPDPWVTFSNTPTKIGSSMLAPACWDIQHFQEHDDQIERRSDVDGTEEIQIVSVESVQGGVHPEVVDNTEAQSKSGPPLDLQPTDHTEDVTLFTPDADVTRMTHLQPIPEPDTVLSERSSHSLDPAGLSSGNGHQAIDILHVDPAVGLTVHQDLDDADRAFLSSLSSSELELDVGVNVIGGPSHTAPTTSSGADHLAHENPPVNLESVSTLIHIQEQPDNSTIDENSAGLYVDHSAVTLLPQTTVSERNESDTDGPGIPSDSFEKTPVSEGRHDLSQSIPFHENVPAEVTPSYALAANSPTDESFALQHLEPTYSSSFIEEDSNDDSPSKRVLLHPAVFDDHELTPSPAHSDIEIPDVDEPTNHQFTVTTLVSDHEELDRHDILDVSETLVTEEIGDHHAVDAIFSEYVACELGSEACLIKTEAASLPVMPENSAQRYGPDDVLPTRSAPTISMSTGTPPLSPTATVENSSSAPDPSIATSDLSTVNRASVSVVTSTGSPPPIHVPRVVTTQADIQQPLTNVGYASDDGQNSRDGSSALPDPRLPPEPTHLGIPVGVVEGSLANDKEERAESIKVEPPRSESEGDSLFGDHYNKLDIEASSSAQPMEEMHRDSQEDAIEHKNRQQFVVEKEVSTSPVDQTVTEPNIPDNVEEQMAEASNGFISPQSSSDKQSKDDGSERVSLPTDPLSNSVIEGSNLSQSPPFLKPAEPLPKTQNNILEIMDAAVNHDTQVPPKSSSENDVVTSCIGLTIEAGSFCQKQNGAEQFLDSPSAEGASAADAIDGSTAPPISCESVSPAKSESRPRRLTKRTSRTKAVDRGAPSPPPPPQLRIHLKRSPATLKRRSPFETFTEPSKKSRLTLSPTATKSRSSSGDGSSTPGPIDDKSDMSPTTSSSSAVSRLLVQRKSLSSRSPSIKSQPSPIGAEQFFTMPSPIRKYVPHNHNHAPAAPPLRYGSVERAPPMHATPSVSPSPTPAPPQSSSTHLTRASCTDHKISIPGPDGLLYFLVPRCSLLDPEVEKDVSIVDCGVATRDEVERAIGDLEAIHLDSTTLGVIRQLAGIQLMREGQVGYLPRPGESFRHRVKHGRPQIHHISPAQDVPPKVEPRTPTRTGPSHVALSLESPPSPLSSFRSNLSEITEDETVSPSKSSKVSQADEEEHEATREGEGVNNLGGESVILPQRSPMSHRSQKNIGSRKRKLRPEDAAYKPEIEAAASSSDGEGIGGRKRIKRPPNRKTGEGPSQDDNRSGNPGTPSPKKRKRKDTEQPDNLDESLNGTSGNRRKKARRKKVDDRHAETNQTTAV